MPTSVDWYLEGRVIAARLYGNIEASDIEAIANDMVELVEASDAPLVHILVDVQDMTGFPKSLSAVSKASSAIAGNKRVGWAVHYGTDNQLLKFLSYMVTQMFKVRFRLEKTKEEAVAWLQSKDASLPPLDASYEPFIAP